MKGLLCHTAVVQTKTNTNAAGRITTNWTAIGKVKCRFTQPKNSSVNIVEGAFTTKFDATIFALPEFAALTKSADLPIRLVTTDGGWAGTYEMQNHPRTYCGYSSFDHVEFDVKRVANE